MKFVLRTGHLKLAQRLLPSLVASLASGWLLTAQASAGGPSWAELSVEQKQTLAPLAKDWTALDAERKQKWLEIAARYPSLPKEQQARMQQRMNEWARLTPEQRGQARMNFQQAKALPATDRQAQWEAYKALPKEQKDALARQAGAAASAPVPRPDLPSRSLRTAPLDAQAPKTNIVVPAPTAPQPPRVVAPAVVQTGPGASTRLVSSATPTPPQHQQSGQPKIDVREGAVDRATLLPRRTQTSPTPKAPATQAPTTVDPTNTATSSGPATPASAP